MLCSLQMKYKKYSLTVPPLTVETSSNSAVREGSTITLWCESPSSNPQVTMQWTENGDMVSSDQVTESSSPGLFSGSQVHSQVVLHAEKSRNGNIVTCTPQYEGVLMTELSQRFELNVTCEYPVIFLYATHRLLHCC